MNSDSFLKISAGSALLLAGLGIFYHFAIFLPNDEKEKSRKADIEQNIKIQKEIDRQVSYSNCISDAEQDYHASWNERCEFNKAKINKCLASAKTDLDKMYCSTYEMGYDTNGVCLLRQEISETLEKRMNEAKKLCETKLKLLK
jgi:hypothetical protein